MTGPRFGPAGRAASFEGQGYKKMSQVVDYLQGFGLTAFEYQGGHGVKTNPATLATLAQAGAEAGIAYSFHAPYYISMASEDPQKRENSVTYLLQSAAAVKALGGQRIIFHCGGAGKGPRAEAAAQITEMLARTRQALDDAGYGELCLCPETMGRLSQFGTLDEVLALCKADKRHIPCLDMGHLNAVAQGAIRTESDYAALVDAIGEALPDERARAFHVHFSKIEYTAAGEKRHLTFEDATFGPPYEPFLELCAKRGLAPTIICESAGTQSEDAREMMLYYNELINA